MIPFHFKLLIGTFFSESRFTSTEVSGFYIFTANVDRPNNAGPHEG